MRKKGRKYYLGECDDGADRRQSRRDEDDGTKEVIKRAWRNMEGDEKSEEKGIDK